MHSLEVDSQGPQFITKLGSHLVPPGTDHLLQLEGGTS